MKEQILNFDYDYYEDWERLVAVPDRLKPTKFRDEQPRNKIKKSSRKQRMLAVAVAKKTLLKRPEASILNIIRESNFPLGLLSNNSVSLLETEFRRVVKSAGINAKDLHLWLLGEEVNGQQMIRAQMRGSLFEEVVTREFAKKNPNHFVSNPVLTSKIIGAIIAGGFTEELGMPDHLVFLMARRNATLIGFIEDKAGMNATFANDELPKQLERQRKLMSRIASDPKVQTVFRREIQKNLPSFPYAVFITPVEKSTFWLATPRDNVPSLKELPDWVSLFVSSTTKDAIKRLSSNLIDKRFIPRLLANLGESC